jgi:hypothetical protein
MALFADTLPVVMSEPVFAWAGCQPAGFQSGAGTRISSQPTDMNTA